jgi:aryl-alcohol dehydrogenase-like predicted oxidoreductase
MKVSEIGLGTAMHFALSDDQDVVRACVKAAVDSGINFIDMADVYPVYAHGEAEQSVAGAIRDLGLRRQDLVLSSKVFWSMSDNVNDRGLSRKHIFESVHGSLRRLGTDYLDIYFCHRYDPETPVEEVVRAMGDLISQGKVLYWGTGAWSAARIEEAVAAAHTHHAYAPRAEQPWYSMLARHIEGPPCPTRRAPGDCHAESSVLNTCARHGIGITVFWPLAQGLLTGKYNEGVPPDSRKGRGDLMDRGELTEENVAKVRQLTALARDLGLGMTQLALAWVLRRPEISSVITGVSRAEQVPANATASGVRLSADTLQEIDHILDNAPGGV